MCKYTQEKCAGGCGTIIRTGFERCAGSAPVGKRLATNHPGNKGNTTEKRSTEVCKTCKGKGKGATDADSAFGSDSDSSIKGGSKGKIQPKVVPKKVQSKGWQSLEQAKHTHL